MNHVYVSQNNYQKSDWNVQSVFGCVVCVLTKWM